MPNAIELVRRAFRAEEREVVIQMPKTHALSRGRNTLHSLGAVDEEAGYAGVKAWSNTAKGSCPVLA